VFLISTPIINCWSYNSLLYFSISLSVSFDQIRLFDWVVPGDTYIYPIDRCWKIHLMWMWAKQPTNWLIECVNVQLTDCAMSIDWLTCQSIGNLTLCYCLHLAALLSTQFPVYFSGHKKGNGCLAEKVLWQKGGTIGHQGVNGVRG